MPGEAGRIPSADDRPWHALSSAEAIEKLGVRSEGLTAPEAAARLNRYGPNALAASGGPGPLKRFLLQFHQPLIYVLLFSGAVTAAIKGPVDAGVIFAVVLLNAIIGFVQELKAASALAALARSARTRALVRRDGREEMRDASELVPGDIVRIQAGDKVPADLRLVEASRLRTDESVLTGESLPVEKNPAPLEETAVLAARANCLYASTLVTAGQGEGVVVATGAATEVGRISTLLTETSSLETPLTRKMAEFSHVVLYVIFALAAVTFGIGIARGREGIETLFASIAFAVAVIPEGLPAAVTITLAIGVHRLARRGAVTRSLPAVETLGSTTVICTDKTGTLTENQMTVREIYAGGRVFTVTGGGYEPSGLIEPAPDEALRACLRAGLLCNDSALVRSGSRWNVQGDPTEGALLVSAAKAGLDRATEEERNPRLAVLPFDSEHKYMATLHRAEAGGVVFVKGALEKILPRCGSEMGPGGGIRPIDAAAVSERADAMARRALRVLAFACIDVGPAETGIGHETVEKGLVFLGLQGMIDPPRPEAIRAAATCARAGISVRMITGDNPVTASAIAREIGILPPVSGPGSVEALTGADLASLSPAEFAEAARRVKVFARVTPEQKLRLVEALQAEGQIVAMTGDGVNDAPALKRADIGVAMGITGTEVAKEAADLVLTDDNFATIEAAVEEGRGIFDNLTKFIVWMLPTNLGQGLVILAAILLNQPLPIQPIQILWINMTTAILLGLALAFEPPESDLMSRPPRDPKTPIVTRVFVWRLLSVALLMTLGAFGIFEFELIAEGADLETAETTAVNVIVLSQIAYLFNCRSLTRSILDVGLFTNRWVFAGVGAMLAAQVFFVYHPFMNRLFHTSPVPWYTWVEAAATGLIIFGVIGTEKWLRRRRERKRPGS